MVRFNDTLTTFSSSIMAIFSIFDNVVSVGSHLSMVDFVILKKFKVIIRPPRASNILEVLWQPPPRNWIKLNCDKASTYPSIISAYGGLARENGGCFLGDFAYFLGASNSLIVEISATMQAIEFTHERNWHTVWLKLTWWQWLTHLANVPSFIRNILINCINLVSHWNFVVSHIFREGNSYDALVIFRFIFDWFYYFNSLPLFLMVDFVKKTYLICLF